MIVHAAKTTESVKIPFRLWTLVGPMNRVLDGGPDPQWEGQFCGKGQPIIKHLDYCPCTMAMWPFVKLLRPLLVLLEIVSFVIEKVHSGGLSVLNVKMILAGCTLCNVLCSNAIYVLYIVSVWHC